VRRDERPLRKPGRDSRREHGLAERAARNADYRDADLDGREKVAGIVGKLERRAGSRVTFLVKLLQPRLARRHDSHLRHGEKAVDEEQQQQYEQLHGGLEMLEKSRGYAFLQRAYSASSFAATTTFVHFSISDFT
jgi:hypothetical protein